MIALNENLRTNTSCRVCKGNNLQKVLSLGKTPPANAFLRKEDLSKPEQMFPLELYFCKDCSFAQLLDIVSPELLFKDYVYVSSTSPVFVSHFKELANHVCSRFNIPANSLVLDIGSNDGILLRPFKEKGCRVLGVDPAVKIAELATKSGIETVPAFFNVEVAKQIVASKGNAKIVTATSVFPHIDDLDTLVAAVKEVLSDDGMFIIEAYYVADMIQKNLFDTIYHEHLSYFSVKTIQQLLSRLGMQVFDVEKTDTHGGSIRVYSQKSTGQQPVSSSIAKFLQEEEKAGIHSISTYEDFSKKVDANKQNALALFSKLKSEGKKIVGYGAPAKATTLLNYFGVGADVISYIVDDSAWKQGLYLPGMKIPVVSSEELKTSKPDYISIFAWNFARPIMKKIHNAGKFIVPVPNPIVLNDVVEQDLFTIADTISDEAKMLEGKTVLITGGCGFIGSYFIATIDFMNKHMFSKPCKVISLDNHIVGRKNNLIRTIDSPHIKFIEHNVCMPFKTEEPVNYVINAAGVASPVYYKKFPIETIEGTIFGLKNMAELAREKNAQSVLYFSSSEIYGDPHPSFIPTPEHYKGNVSSLGPRSCYDESKRVGETLSMAYHRVHNLPIKIVRPFNVYGPGMSAFDYRVVPTFLSQGMQGKTLTVHGHGQQTRTFCYVTDAIIGFFKVLLSGKNGEVYNIGNDNDEITMHDLSKVVAEHVFDNSVRSQLIAYPENYPQDEPSRRCPDLTKAKSDIGYSPSIDLKTGLKRSLTWFKENTNLSMKQ